jgi:glycoside/pentoside/hexuronide:cation symporter, GPH family
MALMFTRPPLESQALLFAAVTLLFCLLCTAYTLVNIPYAALLPELTRDFHQRTVLSGYRMSFAVVGTFIGAGAVLPIVALAGWTAAGAVTGGIMTVTALATFFAVREPARPHIPPHGNLLRSYGRALRSRVFLTALLPWTLHITGVTIIQGALLYYFKYIYGREALFQVALLCLLTSSLLFIFVWVALSKRIGKKTAYNLGMGLFALGVGAFFLFGHRGGPVFAFITMAVAGIGFSTHYVMPHSILPDVAECDYAETGVRQEGMFSSLWTFASKVGQAFAMALSGWVLSLFGYVPDAAASESALLGIRLLCGPIPIAFFVAGIAILSAYPVTGAYYSRVLEKIAAMERRAEASAENAAG